jgi:hypothetical protein
MYPRTISAITVGTLPILNNDKMTGAAHARVITIISGKKSTWKLMFRRIFINRQVLQGFRF